MKNQTRFLFIILFALGQLLTISNDTFAVIANPEPVTYTQPDGSKLTLLLKGDEFIHWAVTIDGYTIMTNSAGTYEYAAVDISGNLVFSGIQANDPGKRRPGEVTWLKKIEKGLFFSTAQVRDMKSQLINSKAPAAPLIGGFPSTGTRKLLMILANFSNTATTYGQTDFNNYMNQVNYNGTGSFRDYYLEVSYGQLTVNTTVTVWVTLPNTHDYYGPQAKYLEFAYQAVVAANNQAGVNFAEYDNDQNGIVDGVSIIHQGQGKEETGNVNDIWSHSSQLSIGYPSAQRTFDGVLVDAYTTIPERYSTGMSNIGGMCHEFCHNLGSPDFYDTDGSINGSYLGTGNWDLMGNGSWNGTSGTKPAHPNAWIKAFMNWTAPTMLTMAQTKVLLNAQVYPDVARYNTTTANEYFLCENRQKTGFDVGIPGHGLIIYHVDGNYITSHTASNNINTGSHQGLYPVCAKATGNPPTVYGPINGGGCPYPGTSNKTSFTDATTPHSHSWAGANTGLPLTSIAENTTTKEVSFCFAGCNPPVDPANFTATSFSISQINLSWILNVSGNPVMVAFNTISTFGIPVIGTTYTAGNTIPGGGTILYNGTNTNYSHTGLNPNATYFYKAWSMATGASYSTGTTANATTTCSSYLPVSVTISVSANPVCAGTSVIFTATPTNGGTTPSCQWKVNGTIAGINSAAYSFAPVNNDVVTCMLTSNLICTSGNPANSNALTMSVNAPLTANFEADKLTPLKNETVMFTDLTTGGATAWNWSFDRPGVVFVNGTSAQSQNPQVQFTDGGLYEVTLLATNLPCSDSEIKPGYLMAGISGLWTGNTSSEWDTLSNWDNYLLPDGNTDIVIPPSSSFWPVFAGDLIFGTHCRNLILCGTSSMLTITGDLVIQ